jgi:hypothetical protein
MSVVAHRAGADGRHRRRRLIEQGIDVGEVTSTAPASVLELNTRRV